MFCCDRVSERRSFVRDTAAGTIPILFMDNIINNKCAFQEGAVWAYTHTLTDVMQLLTRRKQQKNRKKRYDIVLSAITSTKCRYVRG